jgi:hypothetical protein
VCESNGDITTNVNFAESKKYYIIGGEVHRLHHIGNQVVLKNPHAFHRNRTCVMDDNIWNVAKAASGVAIPNDV